MLACVLNTGTAQAKAAAVTADLVVAVQVFICADVIVAKSAGIVVVVSLLLVTVPEALYVMSD